MAKRQITQETFNECVRENMEEFDMNEEEAIADAVTQFESQGVDLGTIFKNINQVHPVISSLEQLKMKENENIHMHLAILMEQFRSIELGSGAKELASQNNGISILFQCLQSFNMETSIQVLSTIQFMVAGSKDIQKLLGEEDIAVIYDIYLGDNHVPVQNAALTCLKSICARSERNKKHLMSHGIVARLIILFRERETTMQNTKEIADLIRVLTIHDDTDSMFSQTHDNIKFFVENGLIDLTVPYLHASIENPDLLAAWLAVVKQIAITEDNCRKLVAIGILDLLPTLQRHNENRHLLQHSLGLLRNLAAVDEYKNLVTSTCMEWILSIMQKHATDANLQNMASSTIAAVCLRSPLNCNRVAELHAYRYIGLAMVHFPDHIPLLRQASLAIRNMVVRNENLRPLILDDPHVEKQLRFAMPLRGCGDEAYAALRDLGVDVPLASIQQGRANFNPTMISSNELIESIQENSIPPFEMD